MLPDHESAAGAEESPVLPGELVTRAEEECRGTGAQVELSEDAVLGQCSAAHALSTGEKMIRGYAVHLLGIGAYDEMQGPTLVVPESGAAGGIGRHRLQRSEPLGVAVVRHGREAGVEAFFGVPSQHCHAVMRPFVRIVGCDGAEAGGIGGERGSILAMFGECVKAHEEAVS